MDHKAYLSAKNEHVRRTLREEFTKFFTAMTTESPKGWPAISDSELVDALADSLMEMGKRRGLGVALVQTLVHELQDRVNSKLN